MIANVVAYINNAINFFLYCISGHKFRNELKEMFMELFSLCGRRHVKDGVARPSTISHINTSVTKLSGSDDNLQTGPAGHM